MVGGWVDVWTFSPLLLWVSGWIFFLFLFLFFLPVQPLIQRGCEQQLLPIEAELGERRKGLLVPVWSERVGGWVGGWVGRDLMRN